jgi:hypothetical protein
VLSRDFIVAVKMADQPAYRIAIQAGLHPSTLSRLLHGAERIAPNDRRIHAVAKVLGLRPSTCFDSARVARDRDGKLGPPDGPEGVTQRKEN